MVGCTASGTRGEPLIWINHGELEDLPQLFDLPVFAINGIARWRTSGIPVVLAKQHLGSNQAQRNIHLRDYPRFTRFCRHKVVFAGVANPLSATAFHSVCGQGVDMHALDQLAGCRRQSGDRA